MFSAQSLLISSCVTFMPGKIVGDDTTALESVLQADVWRDRLMTEERELNQQLTELEAEGPGDKRLEDLKEEKSGRLAEVHANLAEMEAESGPARAAQLLSGYKFLHPSIFMANMWSSRPWFQ